MLAIETNLPVLRRTSMLKRDEAVVFGVRYRVLRGSPGFRRNVRFAGKRPRESEIARVKRERKMLELRKGRRELSQCTAHEGRPRGIRQRASFRSLRERKLRR
jgi:hypothetical protein